MLGKAAEYLAKGASFLGGKALGLGGGLFDKIKGTLSGSSNPEKSKGLLDKAKEVVTNSKNERAGLFTEFGKSMLVRQMPNAAAANDLARILTGNKSKEVHFGQNVIETITASLVLMSHFVPNEYMRFLTDIFANSDVFRLMVQYWPGMDGFDIPLVGDIPIIGGAIDATAGKGGHIRKRILEDKDPQAVIMALRVMHQDIVMGKVTFDSLKGLTGGSNLLAGGGMAAGILGLIFGTKALESDTDSSSGSTGEAGAAAAAGGGLIDKAKDFLKGGPSEGGKKGKKIMDLAKQYRHLEQTDMQQNLIALIRSLGVEKSARLVNGSWEDNNDDCTISFVYENGLYYMYFDEDSTSTDIQVKNSEGAQIANFTDWGGFSANSDADDIREAIEKNPSPKIKKKKENDPDLNKSKESTSDNK